MKENHKINLGTEGMRTVIYGSDDLPMIEEINNHEFLLN